AGSVMYADAASEFFAADCEAGVRSTATWLALGPAAQGGRVQRAFREAADAQIAGAFATREGAVRRRWVTVCCMRQDHSSRANASTNRRTRSGRRAGRAISWAS